MPESAALLAIDSHMHWSVPGLDVKRHWRACVGICMLTGAAADLQAQTGGQESGAALAPVTVTANPLGSSDQIAPVSSLSGDELTLRSQSTLGQTLDGLPGVSSTYFGPNASRPVIRGLDGERIR